MFINLRNWVKFLRKLEIYKVLCMTKKAFRFHRRLLNVGVAGFEPTTSSSQTRRDTGLRYTPNNIALKFRTNVLIAGANMLGLFIESKYYFHQKRKKVIPSGIEPETYCLEGSCSIQLSYGTIIILYILYLLHFSDTFLFYEL